MKNPACLHEPILQNSAFTAAVFYLVNYLRVVISIWKCISVVKICKFIFRKIYKFMFCKIYKFMFCKIYLVLYSRFPFKRIRTTGLFKCFQGQHSINSSASKIWFRRTRRQSINFASKGENLIHCEKSLLLSDRTIIPKFP